MDTLSALVYGVLSAQQMDVSSNDITALLNTFRPVIMKALTMLISISCSCRGIQTGFAEPHCGTQTSVTLVPGDEASTSDFDRHQAHTW